MRQSLPKTEPEPNAESAAERPEKQPHPTDPRRWADGTQRPGVSGLATKHGGYARGQRSPEVLALLGDLDTFRSQLEADQGGREELSTIRAAYITRLVEAETLCRLLGADLMQRGIFTKKGRTRSTFAAFLQAMDKWDRIAQRLGMERRTKDAAVLDLPIDQYVAQTMNEKEGGKPNGPDRNTTPDVER